MYQVGNTRRGGQAKYGIKRVSKKQEARAESQETRERLDFFADLREKSRNPPSPLFKGELPQFRLGALSADRQALREEKRMARKDAKPQRPPAGRQEARERRQEAKSG